MDGHSDQSRAGSNSRGFLGVAVVLTVLAAGTAAIPRPGRTPLSALQPQTSLEATVPTTTNPASPANSSAQAVSSDQKYRSQIIIEDVEDTLPTISIGKSTFTIVVQKKRLRWPAAAQHKFSGDDDETAVSFDVKDSSGAQAFRRTLVTEPQPGLLDEIRRDGRLPNSTGVEAIQLVGSKSQGLMIVWAEAISDPDACANHLILGLFDGKLKPFSETFCEDMVQPASLVDRQWKLKTEAQTGFDIFEVRRRAGYFNVIIPVRIEFLMAKLLPAQWCVQLHAAPDMRERCEFLVEAERVPAKEDTFVRLFPEPDEKATPRHVIVKPNSKVEFLSALAHNALDRNSKWIPAPDAMETPWLKVRIDGQVGWVHAEEDLNSLGLFFAG